MKLTKQQWAKVWQVGVHLLAWLPALWLVWAYSQGGLGSNPIRTLTLYTGRTALVLLLLSLTITPLYWVWGWGGVYPWRRPLGVYAFLYALGHFGVFVGLDYGWEWGLVVEVMGMNPYTAVGLLALLILFPLALTSPWWVRRKMGETWWRRLHRGSYLAAILIILHYSMVVRQDYTMPLIYGSILAVLLGIRLWHWRKPATSH
jgi:methionine sulfoxide reductase heme-binding subunit